MADLVTIEIIHARLFARYGSAWRAKYAGIDVETVQKDWLRELSRMPMYAIDFALDNIPVDFPPTAGQFRELCRRAPEPPEREDHRLPAPKPDPQRLVAELERLHSMLKNRAPRQWAYDLQARESAGERLSEGQRKAWREALATIDVPLSGVSYTFMQEELPPGMRTREVDPADVEKLQKWAHEMLYKRKREGRDLQTMTPQEITQALRESGDIARPHAEMQGVRG